jgi:hypothetical protein
VQAALVNLAVLVIVFVFCIIQFDSWVPKFSSSLLTDIGQAWFNAGLLPGQEALTGNMLRLYQMNGYSNIAFGAGVAGVLNAVFWGGSRCIR